MNTQRSLATAVVARDDGVYRYDLNSGKSEKLCDTPAEDVVQIDEERLVTLDTRTMMLRVCTVLTGKSEDLVAVRLGQDGRVPASAHLDVGAGGRYLCVLATSDDSIVSDSAGSAQVSLAWLVYDLETKGTQYVVRTTKQLAVREPKSCRVETGAENAADQQMIRFGPLALVPIFSTSDGKWVVVRGDENRGSNRAQQQAPDLPTAPVYFVERATGAVFPMAVGNWPSAISPEVTDDQRPATLSIPLGSDVFSLHEDGWFAIGHYALKPGVRIQLIDGVLARSCRHPWRAGL